MGESVIKCPSPLRTCSNIHTSTIIAVIEHVQMNLSTFKLIVLPTARHRPPVPARRERLNLPDAAAAAAPLGRVRQRTFARRFHCCSVRIRCRVPCLSDLTADHRCVQDPRRVVLRERGHETRWRPQGLPAVRPRRHRHRPGREQGRGELHAGRRPPGSSPAPRSPFLSNGAREVERVGHQSHTGRRPAAVHCQRAARLLGVQDGLVRQNILFVAPSILHCRCFCVDRCVSGWLVVPGVCARARVCVGRPLPSPVLRAGGSAESPSPTIEIYYSGLNRHGLQSLSDAA